MFCRRLVELNAEGNQLPAMPVGALKLKEMKYLRVRNNFMHPLFWRENTKNEPQVGNTYQTSFIFAETWLILRVCVYYMLESGTFRFLLGMFAAITRCRCFSV